MSEISNKINNCSRISAIVGKQIIRTARADYLQRRNKNRIFIPSLRNRSYRCHKPLKKHNVPSTVMLYYVMKRVMASIVTPITHVGLDALFTLDMDFLRSRWKWQRSFRSTTGNKHDVNNYYYYWSLSLLAQLRRIQEKYTINDLGRVVYNVNS